MKRFFAFSLGILFLLLCSGCTGEQAYEETVPPVTSVTTPRTEAPATIHEHTFGVWEYGQAQMRRSCETCGETELQDTTDEEQFRQLLKGHWEPYEVTFMGKTQLVYYIRTGIWHYYADYTGGDTLAYTSAMGNMDPADFTQELTIQYSHFDDQSNTHHAFAASADGRRFELLLETDHTEPLLRLTPEPETDLFDQVLFSRYGQVAPVVVGTWSGINGGVITYITLNEDLTFTSNIAAFPSGTWQLAPPDGGDDGYGICTIQLFYKDGNGQSVFDLGYFFDEPSYIPDVEADLPDLEMAIYSRGNDIWCFRKLQPEQLQPLIDKGEHAIIGTWASKSVRSYGGEDTTAHILTDYTLTVHDGGTFTMMADKEISGTWVSDGSGTSGGNVHYNYLFTYPGSAKNGERITFYPHSGNLSFCYKAERTKHVTFVQYSDELWADFLAGPGLLPGNYVSRKVVRYDKETGQPTEETETGYTLTIKDDGTVTGMLHKNVSGIWFYDDLSAEGGHRYIFRMDHTPPEQASDRKDDGTLVFDTKIDGEPVVIYFDPQ